ncbi:MAG: hypothetical protein QOE45_454 [Frankiaceae bacterium]|nr:hypothetical protein [Frankiaceae bacterium]
MDDYVGTNVPGTVVVAVDPVDGGTAVDGVDVTAAARARLRLRP